MREDPKSETRNPKSETNSNQWKWAPKQKNKVRRICPSRETFLDISALALNAGQKRGTDKLPVAA